MADNARFRERIALFEIGEVYIPRMGDERPKRQDEALLPDEPRRLVIALTGPRGVSGWQDATETEATDRGSLAGMDFYDLKGVVESLLEGLHVEEVEYRPKRMNDTGNSDTG